MQTLWHAVELLAVSLVSMAWLHLVKLINIVKESQAKTAKQVDQLIVLEHQREIELLKLYPTKAEVSGSFERVWGSLKEADARAYAAHRNMDLHIMKHHSNSHAKDGGEDDT